MSDPRDKLAATLAEHDPEPYDWDNAYYLAYADALLASDVLRDMLAEAEARGRAEVTAAVEAEIEPQWRSILDSLEDYDSTSDAWIAGRNWMIDHLRDALADRGALDRVRAEAWDEGHQAAYLFERGETYPEPRNPYRIERDGGA